MFSYVMIFFMLIIGLGPMVWEIYRRKFDFFNLKNPLIIYFILQLAISGLVTLLTEQPSDIGLDPVLYSKAYEKALFLSLMGLLAFQVGYYTQKTRALRLPLILRCDWKGSRYRWITVLYFFIGGNAFWILLRVNGGLNTFLAERESWRAGGLVGQGFLMFPATGLLVLSALIYFVGSTFRAEMKFAVTKGILLLGIALVPSFILGFRSAVALPVLQFMAILHYGYKAISPRKLALSLGVLIIGFTLYGISREIPTGTALDTDVFVTAIEDHPELIYQLALRSKGTEVVASVINQIDQGGDYDYGWKSAFEAATIIIPGIIWQSKPEPSGERFTSYFFANDLRLSRGYDRVVWGGISPTAVGELYWHFSWIGVIVGLYLLGRVGKVIYSTLQVNLTNQSVLVTYAIIYTSFAMFAEAFQGYVNGLIMFGVVLFFTFLMLTIKFPPKVEQGILN